MRPVVSEETCWWFALILYYLWRQNCETVMCVIFGKKLSSRIGFLVFSLPSNLSLAWEPAAEWPCSLIMRLKILVLHLQVIILIRWRRQMSPVEKTIPHVDCLVITNHFMSFHFFLATCCLLFYFLTGCVLSLIR